MGAGAGFDLLAQGNVQRRQMDYEQKLADRDFLFKTNFNKLLTDEGNLQKKLSASLDKKGNPIDPKVTQGIMDEITQNEGAQRQLYHDHLHPATNPGAIQRLGGWIAGRLHITHPAPSVTTEVGAITIPAGAGASPSLAPLNPYKNPEEQPPAESFAFNKQWAKTGPYATKLSPEEEAKFQQWAKDNKIPWQDSATADYDMRGYWKALTDPNDPNHALASRAPNGHFPDMWKTPYSGVFSRESMYVMPGAPEWKGEGNNAALYTTDGRLVVGAPQSAAEGTVAQGTTTPSLGAGPAVTLPGHKLTVTTLPQKQFDKQQALQAKNLAMDREAAQQAAAGAPIGPAQEAAMKADAANEAWLSIFDAKMKQLRQADPNMSQEDAQRATLELMGVRVPLSYGQPQMWNIPGKGPMPIRFAGDGSAIYASGAPVDPEDLNGATLMPKPGATPHTILNQEQDAYAKSYGFGEFSQLPPALQYAAQQFVQQSAKMTSEFGRATRSTTTKPDATGQLRAVTVWNYTTPFGVKPVEDPLSGLYKLGANKPTLIGQGTAQLPTTPTKKEPAVPRKQAHGEPSRQGNVQISAPLGVQMQTSVLTKAANDYTAAEKIDQMAKRTLAAPDNTVQQRNLALSLIKAMAGRVQMTEYNLYTTKMGVPNTAEGLINGITKSGELPANIVKNLADTAASDLYAARYVLQSTPGGQDWLNAQNATATPPPSTGISGTGGFKWDDDNAPIHKGGR